jgi:hypothetical protein
LLMNVLARPISTKKLKWAHLRSHLQKSRIINALIFQTGSLHRDRFLARILLFEKVQDPDLNLKGRRKPVCAGSVDRSGETSRHMPFGSKSEEIRHSRGDDVP